MIIIYPIPAFNDNYLWLFHRENSKQAYIVDPGDAAPVEQALRDKGLTLAGILITHHHQDHIGGINRLLEQYPVPVYGPDSNKIPQVSHPLADGERLELEPELCFQVMAVPGHTLDHIAYVSEEPKHPSENPSNAPVLFCGDTLFASGCGRLFEGSPAQMQHALKRFAQLPDNTQVCCAHEYTLSNLAFALTVEPDNKALQARLAEVQALRAAHQPSLPSSIAIEQDCNPFLRCHLDSVKIAAEQHCGQALNNPVEVLKEIRLWKNQF